MVHAREPETGAGVLRDARFEHALDRLARTGLRRALYAGDDTTDLDAFAALEDLELAVRVAIASAESPAALREQDDVVLDSPAALVELLGEL